MVGRIVLGCGSVGHVVVEALADRPGDLLVIDGSENRVETLRNEGIAAEHADPRDVGSIVDAADVVFVGGDDPEANLDIAREARAAFSDANLVAFAGANPVHEVNVELQAIADELIDPAMAAASGILARASDGMADRLRGLVEVMRDVEGHLGVFTHDDPDPDAIASAIALVSVADAFGVDAGAYYFGEIAHQENRALVNLLELDLDRVEDFDSEAYDAIALVDHARPGVNDSLPTDTPVDLVIDHHPPRGPVEAGFVDLQGDVGATSTLLVDYLQGFDVYPEPDVATALLYGIRVDTRDFGRNISQTDFEAAAYLVPYVESDVLERVESPSVSGDTLDTISRAIRNYEREGAILVSGVGRVNNRDAIAQAADQLLAMEGVTTTVVFGFMEGVAYLSGRTRGSNLDIGEVMRQAFDQIGSAGGHTDMAGAQLPLGILGDVEAGEESLEDVLADVIEDRFFEVVDVDQSGPPDASLRQPRRPPEEP